MSTCGQTTRERGKCSLRRPSTVSVQFCSVLYGVCGAQVLFSGAWLMYDPPDTRRVFVDEETGVVTSGGPRNRYQVIKCRTEITAFLISCMLFMPIFRIRV